MWHLFSKKKPKRNGWYLCTVEVPNQQKYVMALYWYSASKTFSNNMIMRHVFDCYEVYGYNEKTGLRDRRLYTGDMCDRTKDVIAWKKMPKAYGA